MDADEILKRMRADHDSDWPDKLLRRIADPYPRPRGLSAGELRALEAASYGMREQMTAEAYGISVDTVKKQLLHARRKLRAKNTTHAVAIAIRRGLIK